MNLFPMKITSYSLLMYGVSLLMIRIFLTGEFYFTFLLWNLFLAAIPWLVSQIAEKYRDISVVGNLSLFAIWLLFLPNTFYVITDLIHLKNSTGFYVMLDILLILSFAFICVFLGYSSLNKVNKIVRGRFPEINLNYFNYSILILCSFGIYLGRFLRYNSWNIINNPRNLFLDCMNYLIHPIENKEVWLFTFGFGLFLISLKSLFKNTRYAIGQK